ncbi:NAD(P)H-hydrate dehydratase [Sphingobium subterraneum]|uniref:Bifunctional NAD(P)H-hydrate repair enzyme n=1 Tax=Sphingobium subterraneum TaxID=627688 RepID=A0A841IXH2_9SPHN|nr:NAD(P)H-hydrate dehydratase [Sphingobium subterraneum]MBB6123649.1 hydroxyethylthiazole kinase-like uncharacterized protein yjeF [Sphingobium subterraneum]
MTITAILTAAEMRAAEAAVFASGVPEYALMQRAGRAAAEFIWRAGGQRDTLVLCGPGNNGGDGYVIAAALRERGVAVRVAASAEPGTPSARQARADWSGPVEDIGTAAPARQLVDALFGTGLTRGLDPMLAGRLGELAVTAELAHTVDLPSGIATDSGAILSSVPVFDLCISLGAWKPAHVLRPAAQQWKRMVCADIGIESADAPVHRLAKPRLAPPDGNAHKYTRGLVAVVAGAMAGAGALAAEAAARAGAGYVTLIGAQAIVPTPHAIVRRRMKALNDTRIGCVLVGPGLGREGAAHETLRAALAHGHPAVVDADGLHGLAQAGFEVLPQRAILTPHAGEFAALFPDIEGSVIEQARAAARASGAVVVLKGSVSVAAASDGRACVSEGASPWLSTAGTGDVLAGLCAARLAVTGDPFAAATQALWLHREAARRAGPAFIADDLLPQIAPAIGACL